MPINDIFDQFAKLNVLIIGDVMLDSYLWGKVERISPEAPVPIVNVQKREIRLGGAANVALNILSLGAKPILCSVVGDDADGENLLALLDKHGMSQDGILQVANRPTTIKHRIIASSQHILRVDSETDKAIKTSETDALLLKIKALIPKANVIIFEDYDKGTITPDLIKNVVALAKQKLDMFNSLGEETDHYWSEIRDGRYLWDAEREEVICLRSFTKEEVLKAYDEWLAPGSKTRRKLAVKVICSEGDAAAGRPETPQNMDVSEFNGICIKEFHSKHCKNQTYGKIY